MITQYFLIIALLVPAHSAPNDDNTGIADIPDKIEIHVLDNTFTSQNDCEVFAKLARGGSSETVPDGPVVSTQCINIPRE